VISLGLGRGLPLAADVDRWGVVSCASQE